MKKLIITGLICGMLISAQLVHATDSSGSAVLGSESSPSGSILEKLNQLKTEIASKAAEIKAEIGRKIDNRAWNGVVVTTNLDEIVIKSDSGDRKIKVNEYTLYSMKTKGDAGFKDLKEGDFVVAIGDVDDNNVLNAKKIVRTKAVTINKRLIWGQILGSLQSTINLKTLDGNKNIGTDADTVFMLGKNEASMQDAKKDKFLLAIIEGTSSSNLQAQTIYFIPTTGYFKPEPKPTPTASASATPKKTTAPASKK